MAKAMHSDCPLWVEVGRFRWSACGHDRTVA